MEGDVILRYFSRLALTYGDLSFPVCVPRKIAQIPIFEGTAYVHPDSESGLRFH